MGCGRDGFIGFGDSIKPGIGYISIVLRVMRMLARFVKTGEPRAELSTSWRQSSCFWPRGVTGRASVPMNWPIMMSCNKYKQQKSHDATCLQMLLNAWLCRAASIGCMHTCTSCSLLTSHAS